MVAWDGLVSCRKRFLLSALTTQLPVKTEQECCDNCTSAYPLGHGGTHPSSELLEPIFARYSRSLRLADLGKKMRDIPQFSSWTKLDRESWVKLLIERGVLREYSFPLWRKTLGPGTKKRRT